MSRRSAVLPLIQTSKLDPHDAGKHVPLDHFAGLIRLAYLTSNTLRQSCFEMRSLPSVRQPRLPAAAGCNRVVSPVLSAGCRAMSLDPAIWFTSTAVAPDRLACCIVMRCAGCTIRLSWQGNQPVGDEVFAEHHSCISETDTSP